jgi:hypothetical protein
MVFLILLTIVLGSIYSFNTFKRTNDATIFFFESIDYYFVHIFDKDLIAPLGTFDSLLKEITSNGLVAIIPTSKETFGLMLKSGFFIMFNLDYFNSSNAIFIWLVKYYALILAIILLLVILVVVAVTLFKAPKNPRITGSTKGRDKLIAYKHWNKKTIYKEISNFFKWIKEDDPKKAIIQRVLLVTLTLSFLYFTQVIYILLSFTGYLFIMVSNLAQTTESLYKSFFVLIVTLFPTKFWILFLPTIYLLGVLIVKNAKKKINDFLTINNNFIDSKVGITVLIAGIMRSGKDLFMIALAKAIDRYFHGKLKETMDKYRNLFSDYNFEKLDRYIDTAKKEKWLDNSLQLKLMCRNIRDLRIKNANEEEIKKECAIYNFPNELLNYDKVVFTNKPIDVLDLIENYGCTYFLYDDVLIKGNLAISMSFKIENEDYKRTINYDIFENEKNLVEFKKNRTMCSILDFDTTRLGKRFDKYSALSDAGIFYMTEADKEEGNQKTNAGKKRDSFEVNQNNQDFNHFLKLCGHLYTIDNYPFVKFLSNTQRFDSINLDFTQICQTKIALETDKKVKFTIFGYGSFLKPILDILLISVNKRIDLYEQTRNYRSLYYEILISLANKLQFAEEYLEGNYGYYVPKFQMTNGNTEEKKNKKFYICFKEVYSKAYSTDCDFGLFAPLIVKRNGREFSSIKYNSIYVQKSEFEKQHSLLYKDLMDCPAMNPPLDEGEYEKLFDEEIKTMLCDHYPTERLQDIFKKLKDKFGKNFGTLKTFQRYIKKKKYIDSRHQKLLIKKVASD